MAMSVAGPMTLKAVIDGEGKGQREEKSIAQTSLDAGYRHRISRALPPGNVTFHVGDANTWGWAIAVACLGICLCRSVRD